MRKARYTTPETIGADARAWMVSIEASLRHRGPVEMNDAALIVLDAQRWFLDPDGPAFLPAAPAIADNLRRLAVTFRKAGLPVIFTRHSDPPGDGGAAMEAWWGRRMDADALWFELAADCGYEPGDRLLDKSSYSAFRDTEIETILKAAEVGTLVLAGVQTHLCVETTARDAFMAGFAPVVALDATAAPDLELHLGSLKGLGHGFARIADTDAILSGLGVKAPSRPPAPAPERTDPELLVVGGGPAGMAAAIQAHRMGIDTRLLERDRPGGLVGAALLVENYPGFPSGLSGSELASRFVAQARNIGVRFDEGEAVSIEEADGRLLVTMAEGRDVRPKAVIVATGTEPVRLGVPGEVGAEASATRYRVDRIEEGSRGKTAFVVGSGDCALDQALHLWHRGYRVSILVRGTGTKAIDLLADRVAEAGLDVMIGHKVTGIRSAGDSTVLSIEGPNGASDVPADVVLVAVGRRPCVPGLPGLDRMAGPGEADALGRTRVPGVYLAGDCRRGWIRQTAVAVGDGVASVMDAARYLAEGKWK